MRAAVDDVQHGHGQHVRAVAADPTEQRDAGVGRRRLRNGERAAEDGVGAEARLVLRAVELDQRRVDGLLIVCIEPSDRSGDLPVDVAHGLQHALAAVAALVAVAQLDRLELPGRRAGRNGGAAGRAGLQRDLDLHGRIAARVEDLTRMHTGDRRGGYRNSTFARSK